ncbi:hypothetical protein [Streptomyces sp. NPDC001774]
MAKQVLRDVYIEINNVDLSSHVNSVEISMEKAEVDSSNFGNGTSESVHGLKSDAITVNFHQDFAASSVDATLYPLYNNETSFPVLIRGTSASVSATNPEYTATCKLFAYQPLNGSIGDLSETSVEFKPQGDGIVRETT